MPARDDDSPEAQVRALYRRLLASWNERDARAYASSFATDASVVGFDGSQMDGRAAIEAELSKVFADHPTRPYVGIVREVRSIGDSVAILRGVAGMYWRDEQKKKIDAKLNAVQSLVVEKSRGQWRAALFQNTPAVFHGRPELSEALTKELQSALDSAHEQ
jgi:uncharacterized protein (TIGR02246 family)